MVEKGAPLRRSRRAASLTAQVLWSLQLEDDSNLAVKSSKKTESSANDSLQAVTTKPKAERKRKVSEVTVDAAVSVQEASDKKRKLAESCSGHTFPKRQPLLTSKNSNPKKKLTASVAPLVKPRIVPPVTSQPVTSISVSNMTHRNPILLLPVSLQPNEDGINSTGQKVGGLQLVTVQAPPGFLNCLNFNKPVVNATPATQTKSWSVGTSKYVTTHSRPIQPGIMTQIGPSVSVKTVSQSLFGSSKIPLLNENVKVQLEPLNLKVGETTVPNVTNRNLQQKQHIARIQPIRPTVVSLPKSMIKSKVQIPSGSDHKPSSATKTSKNKRSVSKSQFLQNPSSKIQRNIKPTPVTVIKNKQSTSFGPSGDRKCQLKCPSPDYACSSPDVDDVDRVPRHTCNKRHINLRNKAAPAPGTVEYDFFVEQQRRLLSAIKRKQRNKAKAAAKTETKKTKIKRKDSDENDDHRSLASTDLFKLQTTKELKHGWKWWGKPYTSLVYSVSHNKYVPRTCYPAIFRKDEEDGSFDVILVRDCVFLMADENDGLSYVAKIWALWESPISKEMTMSVTWYYRPEQCYQAADASKGAISEDEIYSSKHQDNVSVACVEQRCKVLTYSKFCRLHSRLKKDGMWRSSDLRRIVPPAPKSRARPLFSFEEPLDPEDMFFSRYLYDVHLNRVRYKLPLPVSLSHEHTKRGSASSSSMPKRAAS